MFERKPPNIEYHRYPVPDISFQFPNLPVLIEDIIKSEFDYYTGVLRGVYMKMPVLLSYYGLTARLNRAFHAGRRN
jgi:hypothetical protein